MSFDDKRNAGFLSLAQMVQANPRAYGESHVRKLCGAVISLLDQLKAEPPDRSAVIEECWQAAYITLARSGRSLDAILALKNAAPQELSHDERVKPSASDDTPAAAAAAAPFGPGVKEAQQVASLSDFEKWWASYWGYDGRNEDVSESAEAAWNAAHSSRAPIFTASDLEAIDDAIWHDRDDVKFEASGKLRAIYNSLVELRAAPGGNAIIEVSDDAIAKAEWMLSYTAGHNLEQTPGVIIAKELLRIRALT